MTEGNVFTLSVTEGGGDLYLIILPLVPYVIFVGYPSDWSQVPAGGRGTPVPGQASRPGQDGVPPSLKQNSRASTCYAAVGMPLTFSHEDCIVFTIITYFRKSYMTGMCTPVVKCLRVKISKPSLVRACA